MGSLTESAIREEEEDEDDDGEEREKEEEFSTATALSMVEDKGVAPSRCCRSAHSNNLERGEICNFEAKSDANSTDAEYSWLLSSS